MNRRPWASRATAAALVASAGLLVAKAAAPAALAGADWDTRLLFLGALSKLLFQSLGAAFAFASAARFDRASDARPAWRALGAGLLVLFLGQLVLVPYQLIWGVPSPFPSLADVFFMLSYPLLIAALVLFLRAYEQAGYPVGTAAMRLTVLGGTLGVGALAAWPLLRPVITADTPLVEKTISLAYPVLDLVTLAPALLLLRITLALRGGSVMRIWLLLVAGVVAMALADVLFAYFSNLGLQGLDPLVDAGFVLAYGCMALAALTQWEALRR